MPNLHIPVCEAGGRPGQAKERPKENAVYCIFILDPCLMENIPVQEHLVQYLHETHKDNTTSPSRDTFTLLKAYRMNECDLFQVSRQRTVHQRQETH